MQVLNNSTPNADMMPDRSENISGFINQNMSMSGYGGRNYDSRLIRGGGGGAASRSMSPADLVTGHRRIQTSTSLQMTQMLTTSDFRASKMPLHKKINNMKQNAAILTDQLAQNVKLSKAVRSGFSHLEVKAVRICNELLTQEMTTLKFLIRGFQKEKQEDRMQTRQLLKQVKTLDKQKCALQENTYIVAAKIKQMQQDIGLGHQLD